MINLAMEVGRFVADPELKTTESGISVTSFTLAVERKTAPEQEKKTDFIDMVAWRGLAEFICRHFTKGQRAAVRGTVQTRIYEDKQGNKRKKTEIVVQEINFADSKNDKAEPGDSSEPPEDDFADILLDDDLPF